MTGRASRGWGGRWVPPELPSECIGLLPSLTPVQTGAECRCRVLCDECRVADCRADRWLRQERYWIRRHREERAQQKVQQVLAETMNAPVLFLPALPEAQAIARATWAKDPTAPRRDTDREESIREVMAHDCSCLALDDVGWLVTPVDR